MYIFSLSLSISQWQWHTKLTPLAMFPFVRVPNESNIKFFFVGQLHTSIVLCQFCFNWMNVDLRYEAKLLMFQSAIASQTVRAHYFGYLVWSNDVSLILPTLRLRPHRARHRNFAKVNTSPHCFRSVLQKIEIR